MDNRSEIRSEIMVSVPFTNEIAPAYDGNTATTFMDVDTAHRGKTDCQLLRGRDVPICVVTMKKNVCQTFSPRPIQ